MVFLRRTLRSAALTALAAGCLLTASARNAIALQTAGLSAPLTATTGSCAVPPPAANLPAGEPDSELLWPGFQLALSEAGVWYVNQGKDVTVAVIDTGVDRTNPVFGPNTVLPGASVADPGGRGDYDCDGHGTAVAAIVAGRESGLFGFAGVAPQARILPIRATADAAEPETPEQLADAILTASSAGARVINVSIGVSHDSPALQRAVQNALARDALIVAPVGLDGTKSYPASIPGVLAVGAVDAKGGAAQFEQSPGVMVAAPGGRMAVPAAGDPNGLTAMQGTDLAVPFVSGAAALVLSYRPTLHNWQVVERLEATADQPSNPSAAGTASTAGPASTANTASTPRTAGPQAIPDAAIGYGIIDPYRAVSEDLPTERRPDPSGGPGDIVSPAAAAVPGADRDASRLALGVSTAGVLALAAPVVLAAARRGRPKGTRAGV
jgi:subtilisin family serine protease